MSPGYRLLRCRLRNLCLVRYYREVLALESLATRGAVCEPFSVGLAPFLIVEEYPVMLSSDPPELPPDLAPLLA
jgi:hypothetical protein